MQPQRGGDLGEWHQVVGERGGREPDRRAQRTEVRDQHEVDGHVHGEGQQDVGEVPRGTAGHRQHRVDRAAAGRDEHRGREHDDDRCPGAVPRAEQS